MIAGDRYGCLDILDDGQEFIDLMESAIDSIISEKTEFINSINNGLLEHKDWHGWNGNETVITPAYLYTPKSFTIPDYYESIRIQDFDDAIAKHRSLLNLKHYKCKCRKCGRIRHYNIETLESKPQFCLKPMYCSERFTYSTKASNASYRKRQKYGNNEAVLLVGDKESVAPSWDYCEKWNEKRIKELKEQAEKDSAIIASLPRVNAKNYNESFVGTKYESLDVVECINGALESIPVPRYNQRHQKLYGAITVYKQYRCKCYLCGKEITTTCDKFGIYPPTEYGATAYYGYWSRLYCDCHPISSFQWIVNKLLIENNIPYRVEVSFPDLLGIAGRNQLRYDFAVYNKDGSISSLIECQGEQHYKPVEEFGGSNQYEAQIKNDMLKREYAQNHNLKLIEISYRDKRYERVQQILIEQGILGNRQHSDNQ